MLRAWGGVRSSGDPVDVRGPAFDVVEGLWLLSPLRDVATSVRELAFVDAAGERVAAISTRRSRDRKLEVARADLSAALIEAARSEAEFRFGDTVADIRSDAHGAEVAFEWSAAERFDLVVGADGVHSQVRRLAFGRRPASCGRSACTSRPSGSSRPSIAATPC